MSAPQVSLPVGTPTPDPSPQGGRGVQAARVSNMIGKLTVFPPPRNRGLPRLRILILRKSGRPDLRWGRVREGGNLEALCVWGPPPPTPRKGEASPGTGGSRP